MINKIKDFLKRFRKPKDSSDFSDQDEFLDDDSLLNEQKASSTNASRADKTGNFTVIDLNSETYDNANSSNENESIKDKIFSFISSLPTKFSSLGSKKDGAPLISPNLSKSIEKLLSRSTRESIHQVALVLFVCSVTYTLGKVTAFVVRGEIKLDSAKDYTVSIPLNEDFNPATLNQVKSINIFRTNSGIGGKKNLAADKKCEEAEQKSNLPIKLINTVVLQDSVKSLASVQIRGDRDLEELRTGDQISNLAKIFKITRLEILVKNLETGMCESITSDSKNIESNSPISVMSPAQSREFKMNKKISGIDNVGNKFSISKTLLDEKMKDIAAVLTQARAVKIQNPDGSLAFKMTELDPQGIFPYLGIQDQDIITSINGKPIYDMNEVMLLFGRIKGLDQLSLGIKREGTDSVQEYSIKK
jgi:hypothetical protein